MLGAAQRATERASGDRSIWMSGWSGAERMAEAHGLTCAGALARWLLEISAALQQAWLTSSPGHQAQLADCQALFRDDSG